MPSYRVACIQSPPMPTFESATKVAVDLAEAAIADGAQSVFLPEYASGFRVVSGRFAPPLAAEADNPFVKAMQALAGRHGVWVHGGSVALPAPDGKVFNCSLVIAPDGSVAARYRKIHLFDIALSESEVYRESDVVSPGDTACIVDMGWCTLGCSICYDLRFPALYESLAASGADLLAIPAAFTRKTGEAHWHTLCRTRAIENGAWVIAACAVGDIEGGGGCYGHSLIVDPWGRVVADGGSEPGHIVADIDVAQSIDARTRIPRLSHRREFGLQHCGAGVT